MTNLTRATPSFERTDPLRVKRLSIGLHHQLAVESLSLTQRKSIRSEGEARTNWRLGRCQDT
jgi:hypothetical protein